MTDFVEIDFLEVGNERSGDAITIRHRTDGVDDIYVVDGGYLEDGEQVAAHIRKNYGDPGWIDHVVLTHSDRDHANGLRTVLREFPVGKLWMNRPWMHVTALMPRFRNVENRRWLAAKLKRVYSSVYELERVAREQRVEIGDVFEGVRIGEFRVLSPNREACLYRLAVATRTPVVAEAEEILVEAMTRAAWGEENLKGGDRGTSAENETSVVQFAEFCGKKVLLTGDAGVEGLFDAHVNGMCLGIDMEALDLFQVPHHGSRSNVSSDTLDLWLGEALDQEPDSPPRRRAVICANQNDKQHPSKAVVRAMIHRGRRVLQTKGTLRYKARGAPRRNGWSSARALRYPRKMEC